MINLIFVIAIATLSIVYHIEKSKENTREWNARQKYWYASYEAQKAYHEKRDEWLREREVAA